MTPQQLTAYLRDLVRHQLMYSTMIWGAPGIGKSSIVAQIARENDIGFVDVRLSQLAPTDLRGLPVPENGLSRWFPPEFLPRDGAGILFLDEINMAPPAMQGMAQQLILDRRVGSYCYDDQTRIMTEHGLKLFRELEPSDRVMTLNPDTQQIEYHIPTHHIKLSYSGEMIHFQGKCLSLCVSPDHQMYTRADWEPAYHFRMAKDLAQVVGTSHHYKVKRFGDWWDGESEAYEIPPSAKESERLAIYEKIAELRKTKTPVADIAAQLSLSRPSVERRLYYNKDPRLSYNQNRIFDVDDWAEFIGWYVAEGSTAKYHNYRVHIAQSRANNLEKYQHIQALIERLGFTATAEDGGMVIHSAALYEYLKPLGSSKERFVPDEIKQLPKHALKCFLEAAIRGDGDGERKIFTASERLRDDYCEIAIKLGYGVTFYWRDGSGYSKPENGTWVVGISQIQNLNASITKVEHIPYEGVIYCVNVQNHIIMVERDGKLAWCGNCVPEGWYVWAAGNRKEDRAAVFDMPAPLANRFLHLMVEADFDSFKTFALAQNIHEQIIAFLAFRPEILHKLDPQQPAWPSPRSWVLASGLHRAGLDIVPAIGSGAAAEFLAYLAVYENLPDIDQILAGHGKDLPFPDEPSQRYAVTIGLTVRADTVGDAHNAFRWLVASAGAEWVQLFAIDLLRLMRTRNKVGEIAKLLERDPEMQRFIEDFQKLIAS